jgi:hypothetical protein
LKFFLSHIILRREGIIMKIKELASLIGLLGGFLFLIAPQGWAQPKSEMKGPTIIHAFAVENGYYGYIWKIYLEAEDPDGQMLKIACSVDQVGYGHYPTHWIYLKPGFQKHFKGYLQWNTFSSKAPYLFDGTQITLKVSVLDKAGNTSKEVIFPFTFQSGVRGLFSLPAPFDQGDNPRLGYISIDLFNPSVMSVD